jgi:hypothetical protein
VLSAGVNTIVDFNTGTLGLAKFETGAVATPYNRDSLPEVFSDCQWYFQKLGGAVAFDLKLGGYASAIGDTASFTLSYPPMRAPPTVAVVGTFSATNLSGAPAFVPGLQTMGIQLTGAAIGHIAWQNDAGTNTQHLNLSAEL